MRSWVLFLLFTFAVGCVYPRRSTSLTSVHRDASGSMVHAPAHIWQLSVVEAHVLPRMRGDLDWDEGGGLPDVHVKIFRNEELLWSSETAENTLNPTWNATLPQNVLLSPDVPLRIELWDRDLVGADPVGSYRNRGLPDTALPGADSRILLEGGSYVTIRVENPVPHRGLGIDEYEVRPDSLSVIRVLPYSPAARANIEAGDRIVAVGDQRVSALSDAQAASALSMSITRHDQLTVVRGTGDERVIDLDRGFVWLTM